MNTNLSAGRSDGVMEHWSIGVVGLPDAMEWEDMPLLAELGASGCEWTIDMTLLAELARGGLCGDISGG